MIRSADRFEARSPRSGRQGAPLIALALLTAASAGAAEPAELATRLDAYVAPYLETGNFSGVALASRSGETLVVREYGMANIELGVANERDTVFHLASSSKPFTTAAILLLEQDGKLSIDDPLAEFLPDFPRGDRITLHHLMINSTGIANINSRPEYAELSLRQQTPESLLAVIRTLPAEFAPGERYGYSNSNYNLLALIVERASGRPFGEFLEERIFAPLGMERTGHHADASTVIPGRAQGYSPAGLAAMVRAPWLDWSVKTGNGSIYSTVDDLNRFAEALQSGKLLTKPSIEKMHAAHIASAGYGWFVRPRHDRPQVHINGRSPGFTSYFGIYPEEGLVVIVLGNIYNSFADAIGEALAGLIFGEDVRAPAFRKVPLSPEQVSRAVGRYQFDETYYAPDWTMTVSVENGYLFNNGDWLMPTSDDGTRFVHRRYTSELEFTALSNGRYSQVVTDGFVGVRLPD